MIDTQPGQTDFIFLKDMAGNYINANDNFATALSMSVDEVLHATDEEIIKHAFTDDENIDLTAYADSFAWENEQVFQGKPLFILDVHKYFKEIKFYLHHKQPTFDSSHKITGYYAHGKEIIKPHPDFIYQLRNSDSVCISTFSQKNIDLYLKNHASKLKLSQREKQCLYYTLRSYTAKNIGEILNISPKTVEGYIENIKVKLNVDNRIQLIEKAFSLGLFKINLD